MVPPHGWQASRFEPSTCTRGGAWQCNGSARRGKALLGASAPGSARLGLHKIETRTRPRSRPESLERGNELPLPWVRLDTAMPDNPKILDLIDSHKEGRAAAFVWTCGLAYSGKHGTDGFITRSALGRLNGLPVHARLLVQAGLWKDEGVGWSIHGWDEFQESTEETKRRAEKARNAAFARWHKRMGEGGNAE